MRIGVLTSSRADFSIYLPLLKAMQKDNFFELSIIAFGTHLSPFYGETVNHIEKEGFEIKYRVESMLLTDSTNAIATAIGLTVIKFADFWGKYKSEFDLVFCLGDRYEMFAAVSAGIPFNICFAHLHGGETTLGAIDNVFRHSITLNSKYHFVSTASHAKRVAGILGYTTHIHNVGALSLANLNIIKFLSIDEFKDKWNIDLSKPTILLTFHPETVELGRNKAYTTELVKTLLQLEDYQILITMPNADTSGNLIRSAMVESFSSLAHIFLIENLGSQSYFTAMKNCAFLLGNTSSGIIEAASFGKYVINLGDRQKGRTAGVNVMHVPIIQKEILMAIDKIEEPYTGDNIYFHPNSADAIIKILKEDESYK